MEKPELHPYTPSPRDIKFAQKLFEDSPGWFDHVAARPYHLDHQLILWARKNLPELQKPPIPKHADASNISGQKRKMEQ